MKNEMILDDKDYVIQIITFDKIALYRQSINMLYHNIHHS